MTERTVGPFSSPREHKYLFNANASHELVQSLRWRNGHYCPRCRSQFIKRVNTNVFRELHRCIDCGYMFNSTSGTLLHGAKLPIVKHLQFIVVFNALGKDISIREICYVLNVSFKTASSLLYRYNSIRDDIKFSLVDKLLSNSFRSEYELIDKQTEDDTFFLFCESRGIVMSEREFLEYLRKLLDSSWDASNDTEG